VQCRALCRLSDKTIFSGNRKIFRPLPKVPGRASDLRVDARGDRLGLSVSLRSTRGDLDQRSSRGLLRGDLERCHDLYLGGDDKCLY